MGASWEEVQRTPLTVITSDLWIEGMVKKLAPKDDL